MGRPYVPKTEPTTSIGAYIVDSMLLDSYCKKDENKTDALKRLFIAFFGEDVRKEMKGQMQKKWDRQQVIHGNDDGDQSTIDNMYFKGATIKDTVFSRDDLMEIVIQAKGLTGELKNRYADDSINKAINRGDLERIEGGYRIIRKWFKRSEEVIANK